MDILVTGGTGFIGRHLCRTLGERGHSVTALGRSDPGDDLPEGVDFVEGDVTEFDSLPPAMEHRDAVVHLVSLSPIFAPKGGGRQHELVTVGGTRNVVRAMNETDVDRLIYLSGLGADPEGPTTFIQTKGRAEEIIRATDLDWTIVRPSVVFGSGAEFVPFVKLVTTPYVTGLPSGGNSMRFQPIWVEDLADLLASALEDQATVEQTYELGGPDVYSLAAVTELVYQAAGRSVKIVPVPMPLARIGLTVAEFVPFIPLGRDQYRSLTFDNVTDTNAVEELGGDIEDLRSFNEYLMAEI